ncbi:hypothetical protein HOC13_00705 [Candidatus Woesearchaeota archaeon]|jgi:hypothetical protein|nr:hypothetical protein [Candidatus Woesearchaeota archaeon]
MAKKCIICEENASYKIKDTPDFYCEECAEENFSDLNLLVKVEEEAHRLKEIIKEKLDEILEKEKELKEMLTEKDAQDDKTREN